jgi:hypothetical protein
MHKHPPKVQQHDRLQLIVTKLHYYKEAEPASLLSYGGTWCSNIQIRVPPWAEPVVLKSGVAWYLNDNKHGLYLIQIHQVETVDTMLWLL